MAKNKRDFDNPIKARIVRGDKTFAIEVASYRVTDEHLILIRREEGSEIIKYLRLDTLASFEIDQPIGMRSQEVPQATLMPVPSGPRNMNPGLDSIKSRMRGDPPGGIQPWVPPHAPGDQEPPRLSPPPISVDSVDRKEIQKATMGLPNGGIS